MKIDTATINTIFKALTTLGIECQVKCDFNPVAGDIDDYILVNRTSMVAAAGGGAREDDAYDAVRSLLNAETGRRISWFKSDDDWYIIDGLIV
jgi:hypothetical protein